MARSGKTIFMRFLKSLFGWRRRRDDAREMMATLQRVTR
jgi:hypothetical protein